jgi:hypothetical protein
MTDTITLPRAVIEQVREALKELDYASEPYVNEIARTALAALDAALAEPKKERAETGIPARGVGVGSGETDPSRGEAYPTPQPDAKREPATHEQAAAAYDGKKGTQRWVDFRDGWQAAERFHGIRKEDKP